MRPKNRPFFVDWDFGQGKKRPVGSGHCVSCSHVASSLRRRQRCQSFT